PAKGRGEEKSRRRLPSRAIVMVLYQSLSRECALLDPVDIEPALGKKPRIVDLHEGVEVAERGDHQASLSTVDRHVMCQAIGFACGSLSPQRKNFGLTDKE